LGPGRRRPGGPSSALQPRRSKHRVRGQRRQVQLVGAQLGLVEGLDEVKGGARSVAHALAASARTPASTARGSTPPGKVSTEG
jgi:hypothetical protein